MMCLGRVPLVLFALALPVLAHPGHEHPLEETMADVRTWTVNGRSFEASFMLARHDRVRLETSEGTRSWHSLADLGPEDRHWLSDRQRAIEAVNVSPIQFANYQSPTADKSDSPNIPEAVRPIHSAFSPFADRLKLRWDDRYFIVESNGLPAHGMMVGIRNWQQQIPLPQPYSGDNAWRIPLRPQVAAHPISARTSLFRGAIAVAVNGVPIFNALNNRGEDAYLIGELDEWGGHCGRADDYHYHRAPTHLEAIVGKGKPIAYALDGYPILGFNEASGANAGPLDAFNGHFDRAGAYHYHATKEYPYINGGMRGVVEVRDGQIEPQPRLRPIRPAGEPLRGATINTFENVEPNRYQLGYQFDGRNHLIAYTVAADDLLVTFTDPAGRSQTERYSRDAPAPRDRRPPPAKKRR